MKLRKRLFFWMFGRARMRGPAWTRGPAWMLVLAAMFAPHLAMATTSPPWPASGPWAATLTMKGSQVPFRFAVGGSARHPSGWFFNGKDRVVSTSGVYRDHRLVLEFAQYGRRLDVTVAENGGFEGTYGPFAGQPPQGEQYYSVSAVRAASALRAASAVREPSDVPRIAGLWIVPAESTKKDEQAWRLIVRQSGSGISATLLRVDGDTGVLTGNFKDGKATVSHFSGARPSLMELSRATDQTLRLVLHDLHGGTDSTLTAYRPSDAVAQGLPAAADPAHHTSIRDPKARLTFSFPDLAGRVIADDDPRFRGKVIVLDISGSWCPNCHDEAPFLEELYLKYRARGLEVVSVSFEEPEQLASLARLKAFIKRYGLTYTVLVGGSPPQAKERLPQAVDLDSWPTTFFIGRDGRVGSVHTGFAGAVTGDFHATLRKDFQTQIEALLAQAAPADSQRASTVSASRR